MAVKEIRIDGVVGDWMNTSEEFKFKLDTLELASDDTLNVVINSVGGSVFEGYGIYNQLKSLPQKVNTRIEGLAASIATLIALAGDNIKMSQVGSFMIHRASTFVEGNGPDLEKQVETLKAIDNTLITVYAAKTGLDKEKVEEMLDAETWMTAEEALSLGFIDEIINKVDARMAAMANFNNSNMNFIDKLKSALRNEGEDTAVEETAEETTEEVAEETAEETAEEVTNEEEEEEEEMQDAVTPEQLNQFAELIADQFDKLNTRLDNIENGIDQTVENGIRNFAKGVRSNGKTPQANGPMNGKKPESVISPLRAQMKEMMNDIDSKTRQK